MMVNIYKTPTTAELNQQAAVYLKAGQLDKAQAACQQALSLDPNCAKTCKMAGNIFQAIGQVEAAKRWYDRAIELDPSLAEAYANMGTLCVKQKQWHQAVDYYQKAIKIQPVAGYYRNLAKVLTILQQPTAAADCWLRAYELEPENVTPEQYFEVGNTLLKAGQVQKAISADRKAIALNPSWAEAYQNLAAALQRADSLPEVTICYGQAIELKTKQAQTPPDRDAKFRVSTSAARPGFFNGNNLAIQSNTSEIETDRHFLEILPHHPDIYLKLGDTLVKQNRPDEAISIYQTAMQRFPDRPEIYLHLGKALTAKNDRVGAMAAYRRAIALDPNHYWSHHHLGDILAEEGKLLEAIASYHRAIQTNPSPSFWHYHNLGTVQGNHGEWEAAIVSYCKAIELNPNYSWSHKNLGDILAAQGKIDEATVCYRRAIKLKPRIL